MKLNNRVQSFVHGRFSTVVRLYPKFAIKQISQRPELTAEIQTAHI